MIEPRTAIIVCLIHLVYYAYFQVISDLLRQGMVHNTPNLIISRLRTDFDVNIKTFQKNSNHYGFAWFKTLYLNENLFKKEKALKWTFHHEHYHLTHKHKLKVLMMRGFFSLLPLMMIFLPWIYFMFVYMAWAYFMHYVVELFEKQANKHANSIIKR